MPTARLRKLRGMDEVIRNLNREIKQIENSSAAGLIEAVAFIRVDIDRTPPLVPVSNDPVSSGNLRRSWFTTPFWKGKKFFIIFGHSANYALYVHERIDDPNWTRPGSGPKWLEYAIKRNVSRILAIIQKRAMIK